MLSLDEKKLEILHKKNKLPKKKFKQINQYKQKITSKILKLRIKKDIKLINLIKFYVFIQVFLGIRIV